MPNELNSYKKVVLNPAESEVDLMGVEVNLKSQKARAYFNTSEQAGSSVWIAG